MRYAFARQIGRSTVASLLGCALLLGSATATQATDVRMLGFTDVTLQWADTAFNKASKQDRFQGTQRTRAWVVFNVSPNLKSAVMFELDHIWGANLSPDMPGGALGTDGKGLGVKEAYVDWAIPDTQIRVRMGLQPFVLPGIGTPTPYTGEIDSVVSMWARGAGLTVSGQINDNVGLTGFWMRASADNAPFSTRHLRDTADIIGLIVPIKGDGYDVRPWAMMSRAGKDDPLFTYRPTLTPVYPTFSPSTVKNPSNYADGFWAGFAATVTAVDPWRFGLDVNYGNIDGVVREMDRSGWITSGMAEYQADNMIPGLLAWYGTGDDSNPYNGSERMPVIFGNWYGTNLGFMGGFDNMNYRAIVAGGEPSGTWGVSLYLRDITLIRENIKQLVRVAYYQGTNDNAMSRYAGNGFTNLGRAPLWLYLTRDDRVFEANLGNYWELYKNFTWAVEAGWMHVQRGDNWDLPRHRENALRVASTWRYVF